MGWLIALGILILIGFIRVGVLVRYDADGPLLRLILGPVKLTLVPAKKKKPKKDEKHIHGKDKKKPKKAAPEQPGKLPTDPPPAPKPKKKSGGPITDFLPLVKVALDFVGEFFTRLRFKDLHLKLILAGDDPCDLAMNYARAWEALGNLAPKLDNALNINWAGMESRVRGQNAFATGHEYCVQHLRGCYYMAGNLRDAYRSEIARDCAEYEQSLMTLKSVAETVVESYND